MAISTDNEKLGVMEWCLVWEPGLPLSPGTLGQADKQQLIWDYPGVLYAEAAEGNYSHRHGLHLSRTLRV